MEDEATWKGHTFTLLVFTGIVVLCSIFFILGMLVGRAQAQKLSVTGPGAGGVKEAKAAPKEEKPDFTFYDSVKKEEPAALQPAPAKPDPEPQGAETEKSPSAAEGEVAPSLALPADVVNYQIGALRKEADAEKLLEEVKKKGFRAFILAPPAGDSNPLFKVQVGPFADLREAQDVKDKLESAGYRVYKNILRK
jgi:DedD protein